MTVGGPRTVRPSHDLKFNRPIDPVPGVPADSAWPDLHHDTGIVAAPITAVRCQGHPGTENSR